MRLYEIYGSRRPLRHADGALAAAGEPAEQYLSGIARAGQKAFGLQFYAFCTVWLEQDGSFEAHYAAALEHFNRQLDENKDQIVRCKNEADARAAIGSGKCGAFLSIEGAEAISCDPGKLELACAQGVRMIAPAWNAQNALTGSCMTGGGLTAQGKESGRRSLA